MLDRVKMRPTWFPDWQDKYVAVIASGPSTTKTNVGLLKDRLPVVVIKKNIELAPWADMVYGCDAPWWRHMHGLPDFKGLKITPSRATIDKYPGFNSVDVKIAADELLFTTPGIIGSGGNSGFQAVNILAQIGVCGILLLGFDMNSQSKAHWYGRNDWMNANNPGEHNFRRWKFAFGRAAKQLDALGIETINASYLTALNCFPYLSVEDALKKWGL